MTTCCKKAGLQIAKDVCFRIDIVDWYDGPSSGIFVCEECQSHYRALLIDWNEDHSERVFSLSPLRHHVDLSSLRTALDRFDLANPNLDGLTEIDEIEDPVLIVGVRLPDLIVSCSRIVSKDEAEIAKTWLLFSDSTKPKVNWHDRLFGEIQT
jgi:hypothetical protein